METCIFCKIASGVVPAAIVLQNQHVVAFRDINPQAPVHILIVPRKHIESLSAIGETDLSLVAEVHRAVQKIAAAEKLIPGGYRVVANEGANGGQTVGHVHYHILGGRALGWPPG